MDKDDPHSLSDDEAFASYHASEVSTADIELTDCSSRSDASAELIASPAEEWLSSLQTYTTPDIAAKNRAIAMHSSAYLAIMTAMLNDELARVRV